jgi:hypothetical protein
MPSDYTSSAGTCNSHRTVVTDRRPLAASSHRLDLLLHLGSNLLLFSPSTRRAEVRRTNFRGDHERSVRRRRGSGKDVLEFRILRQSQWSDSVTVRETYEQAFLVPRGRALGHFEDLQAVANVSGFHSVVRRSVS